jgi:hypothetical protein
MIQPYDAGYRPEHGFLPNGIVETGSLIAIDDSYLVTIAGERMIYL